MVRLLRRVLRLGLLAGVGVGVLKAVRGRKGPDPWADSWVSTGPPGGTRPSPAPVAATPKPAQAEEGDAGKSGAAKPDSGKPAPGRAAKPTRTGPARKSPTGKAEDPPGERLWVPANDGVCPQSHPVKAKLVEQDLPHAGVPQLQPDEGRSLLSRRDLGPGRRAAPAPALNGPA